MATMKPAISATVDATVTIPPPNELPAGGVTVEFTTTDPDMPRVEVLVTTDKPAFEDRMYGRYSTGAGNQ
jgi:hypothetical protein